MTSVKALSRPFIAFYDGLRRLGLQVLVLTLFAIALMSVAIFTVRVQTNSNFDYDLMGPPLVRQAASAAKLMDELGPDARRIAINALNSPMLQFSINEGFSKTPAVENPTPVFVPIISIYKAVLGDRPFSVYRRNEIGFQLLPSGKLSDDLIIVIRLADGSGLVVESGETFRRLAGFYGVALIFGFVGLVLIGLMTWASLSYERPLRRLAEASKDLVARFDANADVKPLPESGPKPVHTLAVALNQTSARLAQLMAERTNTLAAIAHDLRTYLTRLRMRSEFIDDEKQREKIIRDLEDMAQIVEDTLLLGKSVTKPNSAESLELTRWLDDFVTHRAELGEDVTFRATSQTAEVKIAVSEFKRALNNLVDNAIRYAGSATITIGETGSQMIEIKVLDQGPGVPDAFLERMVEPFTRAEQSRSRDTGGTGLGLAIAKALVEQAGGTLDLANRAEGGFSARIELPHA